MKLLSLVPRREPRRLSRIDPHSCPAFCLYNSFSQRTDFIREVRTCGKNSKAKQNNNTLAMKQSQRPLVLQGLYR